MIEDLERRIWIAETRVLRLEQASEPTRQTGVQNLQKLAQLWTIQPEPTSTPPPPPPPVGAILAKYTGCLSGAGVVGATVTMGTGGAVTGTAVTGGGSNYTSDPTATISGDGANATLSVRTTASVASATISSQGQGYLSAPTPVFGSPTLPGGVQATGTANMTGSGSIQQVTSITMTNNGSGYTAAPTITIPAPPAAVHAAGTAVLDGSGHVASVTITNAGTVYTSAPVVSFSGGGGSGATATCTVTNGSVNTPTITNAGSGYTSAPTVFIGAPSSAFAASGTTSRGNTIAVYDLTITNGGGGYSTATIAFSGGGGSGAAATATLSSITTLATCTSPAPQCVVSLSFSNHGTGYTPGTYALGFSGGSPTTTAAGYFVVTGGGTVNSAYITDCGAGYGSTPTLSFPGAGGSGAAATATLGTSTCALGIPATGTYGVKGACTGLTTTTALISATAAINTSTTLAGGSVLPSGYHCVQTVCGRSFPDSSFMTDSNGSVAMAFSGGSGAWWGCYLDGSSTAIKYLIHATSGVLDISWTSWSFLNSDLGHTCNIPGGVPCPGTCPTVASGPVVVQYPGSHGACNNNPTEQGLAQQTQTVSVSPTSEACNDCGASPSVTWTLPATFTTGGHTYTLPVSGTVTFTP